MFPQTEGITGTETKAGRKQVHVLIFTVTETPPL